jgi:hypothetical protein
MTLDFTPTGTAHCLYDEAIDLHALGRLHIRRASHIEFNEQTQIWEVRLVGRDEVVFADASRQRCLGWEIVVLATDRRNARIGQR